MIARLGAVAILVGCLFAWQYPIWRTNTSDTYRLEASSGLKDQGKLVYFLYYLNLYPVASTKAGLNWEFYADGVTFPNEPDTQEYSPAGANRIIANEGESLIMEWGHSTRFGNHLMSYLYLPDAWRLGSPRYAEIRIGNALGFFVGLALLLLASWFTRLRVLGILLVVLLGSNHFQIFEAYRRENIFGWPITTFCLTLGLMLPVLAGRVNRWYPWVAAVGCGVILGTVFQIRPENGSMLLGVTAAFLFAPGSPLRTRAAQAATVWLLFACIHLSWTAYFEHKIAEAQSIVQRAGGHPYEWLRNDGHPLWGSLWAGLGDFDQKYGYSWSDDQMLAFVERTLPEKYGQSPPWWYGVRGKKLRDATDYFDEARIYYRHFLQAPHVLELLRGKAVSDIAGDPLWYATILAKRTWRILTETTPIQVILVRGVAVPVPFPGYVAIGVVLAAIVLKEWLALRLLLFSLPLSLTALLIYSGGRTPYYSVYHIVAAAIVGCWMVKGAKGLIEKRLPSY